APRAALPLAAAIDRFDAELVQAAGGVEGAKRDEIHERFMALDPAAPEPLAVGQLLPVLTKATNQQATARLKRIASWPHDPRVSRALAALLAEMKVLRSESGKGFWGTALIVLGNTPDLRTLDVVRSLGREHSARYGVSTRDWMRKQVKQLRERLERELLREDPLEPRVAEALEHFAREVGDSSAPHGGGERDAAALLHAIYEAPDDDELRAVYADVLSQIGDARGELITLQLARAGKPKARASKRERELLGEHAEAWLGSLSHYLLRGGLRFERGFVAEARWNRKRDDEVDSTLDDPAWSTVHTLLGPAPAALALAPVMRSLRAVQVDVAGLTGKQRASLADQLRARGVEIISA
ncbi:MAG: TIGR02996 domain-containing protein, partial [Myxococcales bacterium]|nr:TIGR02996 domain-containing protein [Myxococcales bacterium]